MRPNPYQLTAFAHVAREGSFTAAAAKLAVSQSAVTQHVKKLEQKVGNKLFLRGVDGLSLTRTGKEILELAERHINLERIIAERLAGFSSLNEGHLTIIANAPVPALSLIARFNALWPDVEIDFTLYDWTTATEMLRNHQVDIALIFEPTASPDWVIYEIGSSRYVLYLPISHPLARHKNVSLRDISDKTLLLPEQGSLTQRVVKQALMDQRITLRRTIKTTTFPVMKEAILQGVGVGIFLEGCITHGEGLASIPIVELQSAFKSCVVVPKDKHDLRLIQSFLSIVDDIEIG